jgi:diguanylate cyclase (GGDEF)-like protein
MSDTIRSQLRRAKVAVSVVTANFNRSSFCLAEAGASWVLETPRLIFVCPPTRFSDLKGPTGEHKALVITEPRDLDTARDLLLVRIPHSRVSVGTWSTARDRFVDKAEKFLSHHDPSLERGLGLIKADLPVPLLSVAKLLAGQRTNDGIHAVVFDIDGLHQVNENYGFALGSQVIREVGTLIAKASVKGAVLGLAERCGDDTFFVVILGAEAKAKELAEATLRRIARIPISLKRPGFYVTASAGIAPFKVGLRPLDWLQRAYFACAAARRAGGNRVELNLGPSEKDWSR